MLDRSLALSEMCFLLFPRNLTNLTQVSERPEFTVAQQRFLISLIQWFHFFQADRTSIEPLCDIYPDTGHVQTEDCKWKWEFLCNCSLQLIARAAMLGISNKSTERSAGAVRRSSLYWWLIIQ